MELDLANDDLLPIVQIESNQVCNDCGKSNPHWCSITNAVFLCPSCARTHKKFNKNISTIKSLEVDDWSKEEIKILKLGGNERFTNLIKSYNIPLTKDNKEYKYYTKAAQYYRDSLIAEAKEQDVKNIKKPSLREGIEILYQDDYLNLFNKNQSEEINIQNEGNNEVKTDNPEKKNWVDRMIDKLEPDIEPPKVENTSKGQQFLNNITSAFNDVKERTKEIDFKGKFKKAGEFVQDKTEQIQNSGAFNKFMSVVTTGIDNVIQTTDKYFFKNDPKIIPVPPNYINPNLIPKNNQNNINLVNQINQPNNIQIMNQNQMQIPNNNINMNNINNINKIEEKNVNLNSTAIKNEVEKNNNKNNIPQPNINNENFKKDEKIDEEEKAKKNAEDETEEKLDENEENDPSMLIMSNIPIHN